MEQSTKLSSQLFFLDSLNLINIFIPVINDEETVLVIIRGSL